MIQQELQKNKFLDLPNNLFQPAVKETVEFNFGKSYLRKSDKHNLIKIDHKYYYPINQDGIRLRMKRYVNVYQNLLNDDLYIKSDSERFKLVQATEKDIFYYQAWVGIHDKQIENLLTENTILKEENKNLRIHLNH